MKHFSGVDKTSWCDYEPRLHSKFSLRCYYVLRFVFFVCVVSIKSSIKTRQPPTNLKYFISFQIDHLPEKILQSPA